MFQQVDGVLSTVLPERSMPDTVVRAQVNRFVRARDCPPVHLILCFASWDTSFVANGPCQFFSDESGTW